MRVNCLVVVSSIASSIAAFGAGGEWISVPDAPVYIGPVRDGARAADGTSWFARTFTNAAEVASARWTVSGLGVFEVFVNGARVGDDFLKPGFTHFRKTKYSFSYDVTDLLKRGAGEENVLAAEVSAGWWRDKIVTPAHKSEKRGFSGNKSAFRGELEITYSDGSVALVATDAESWRCGVAGSVTHAAIYDGEEYDARVKDPVLGDGLVEKPEVNTEFAGEVLPSCGAEVTLRRDLAMARGPYSLKKGETLVVDFEQNCAAVPEFRFSANRGTVLTALPAEMLNDADKGERGCDGPKGSVYRENLRCPDSGMRVVYTFAGEGVETYIPRFTFFGYRYLSITATDDVEIESVASVPVSSIKKEMELGKIETGDRDLNRFIQNVYWGQLSNYLSVPTDCPQRNERLGWSADTQVFCEAGAFNADTRGFFRKYTRDLRDSRCEEGGYPSVAPFSQYGNETFSFGWADVGVIVPWTIWRQFGDESIVRENWDAMSKFVRKLDETKYDFEGKLKYIYADWLSYEKFETCGNKYGSWNNWKDDPDAQDYRRFLAACHWLYDARLMAEMGEAIGKNEDVAWFRASAERALAYIREKFVEEDGLLLKPMRDLQTASVFAIKFGIVEGAAKDATKELLLKSIREHGDCLQTGFLGTGLIMDALTDCGASDVAYTLLLQHKNPSWLYSVDQGATTVWERWNSYTKADGFGPVSMNSFNHYAYGAVLAWMYKTCAGIAADSSAPGFRRIVMAPKPDRRLGYVKAEYKSVAGLVKSAWRYEGDEWIWEFTVPDGATASVTLPGESSEKLYAPGTYKVVKSLPPAAAEEPKGDVVFRDCPKCEMQIRISDDAKTAFVNLSRLDGVDREVRAARARRLLDLASAPRSTGVKRPLMGWSSWNTFGCEISEEVILDTARAMATNGLMAAGYTYVNIDDGFFDGHGEDGVLRFNPRRFPNGMKPTVDGIHALGLKAGIYSDAGADTCGSMWGGGPSGKDQGGVGGGLYGHDAADCKLHFVDLGFDFIKVDYCGGLKLKLDERERYTEIANAIRATGRDDVRLNICRWDFPGTWAADIAESWRTTVDIRANWKSLKGIVKENLYLSAYAKPGAYNDMDMLEVGHLKGRVKTAFGKSDEGFTPDEEELHFGVWCILSSPLLIGCDVRAIPPETLSLVTNPYLLAMSQNDLGLQAYVAQRVGGDGYVLVKDADELFGKARYVALVNLSDSELEFDVKAKTLDLDGTVEVFDMIERGDPGSFRDGFSLKVRPHSAKFYRFDAERRLERTVYEAETAFLSEYQELHDATKAGTAFPTECADASGGVAVRFLGNRETNDLVWKDVMIERGGRRTLVFRCSSPEARYFFVQLDGGEKVRLEVPATEGSFAEVSAEVDFAPGVHAVRVSNGEGWAPDIDAMTIR